MSPESADLLAQQETEVEEPLQQPPTDSNVSASLNNSFPGILAAKQALTIDQAAGEPIEPPPTLSTALSKLRRWRWVWLPSLLLVPALAVIKVNGTGAFPEQTAQVLALPVETTTLESVTDYKVSRTYTGEIVARRSSDLGFERSGAVTEILVDEGDRVQAGEPLASLDIRSLEAQRQQLMAQRDQAVAQLQELQAGPRPEDIAAAQAEVADWRQQVALGRIQRQRREALYERGAISREELDQEAFGTGSLESRLNQAQSHLNELLAGTRSEQLAAQAAQVRQLEANIRSIDVDLSKSILTAPFDGRVSSRLIDEGVVVGGGQTVLRLVEDSALEARIGVPIDTADTLTVGSRQFVQLGADTYSAQVAALLPELDEASRTVTVVLQVTSDQALTVGQTARLVLTETQLTDGYWLPSTALIPGERGLWSIYMLAQPSQSELSSAQTPSYQVARRDVEVLHTEAERVLVRGAVLPGERAITSGAHRIVPGQLVRVSN